MQNSAINLFLEKNDRAGEKGIALIQAAMALCILVLHLIASYRNDWSVFNPGTVLCLITLLFASAYRYWLSCRQYFNDGQFHLLTIADGLILFCVLLSYNIAYGLGLAATFKSPSNVMFVVYTAARMVRFHPAPLLAAGGTVIGGWAALIAAAIVQNAPITTSYIEYVASEKLLFGALFEMGAGYCALVGILTAVSVVARKFLRRTAFVEELEEANKRAEANARSFENLFASSTDGIIIFDRHGIIQRINPSLSGLFGYFPEALQGKSTDILVTREVSERLRQEIENFQKDGYSKLFGRGIEICGTHKDGSLLDIEVTISPFGDDGDLRFAGFIRDIRKRKDAQRIQRKAEERFQAAVDAAMDAIIILDDRGNVTGYNPAAESIFGFSREEIMGRKLSETIVPHRHRDAHDAGMARYHKTGKSSVLNSRFEITGLHKYKGELQIELALSEFDGSDGKQYFGYARDITERKHVEDQLIRARDEAQTATRQKARFLAIMSHEIRTALNGMLGVVSLLGETELDREQKRLINVAEDSGRSLLGIINDILDYSKLEAGKFNIEKNPFRLDLLMGSIMEIVSLPAEKKGLVIDLEVDHALDGIYSGDADRIRQVLLNLIWNAVKFTDSGSIDVTVAPCTEHGLPCIRFEVRDTGIGVPEHKKDELFAEFATINNPNQNGFQGTGLGLAISKAFVEAMDGKIGYREGSPNGSVFWFEIPLEQTQSDVLQQQNLFNYSASFKGLTGAKLLVADDNLTNQLIVKRYLSGAGAQLDVASNGREAVELFQKGDYDLVLMDISMPEMNGYEATAAIRYMVELDRHVPVIAFTAYATEQDKKRILAAGMDDHVTKPFSRDHLIATILKHLPHLSREEKAASDNPHQASDQVGQFAMACGIDPEILRRTLDGMDDDATGEIIAQFSADLGRFLGLASSGLKTGNWEQLEKASHGLKGTAGMFGAVELRDIAGKVNLMCRNGMFEKLKPEAEKLVENADRLARTAQWKDFTTGPDAPDGEGNNKAVNE